MSIAGRIFPHGFDVAPDAPDTYKKLRAHLDAEKRMVVYNGGSEGTIYGDDEVNYCFRAWHDVCHYYGEHDFSPEGEAGVLKMQCFQLRQLYGDTEETRRWVSILNAEVVGQREYYQRYKRYITDQRGFVLAYLDNPESALEREW